MSKFSLSDYTFPQEPVVYVGVANAVILLLVSFGLPITVDQKIAIDGIVGPLGVLAGMILARQMVTPVANLPAPTPVVPPHG